MSHRLAIWLLRRLCGNDALTGDVVELFQRGRSERWLWRQVLIAVVVTHRWHVTNAAVGTILFGIVGRLLFSNPTLWLWSREMPWPWSEMFHFCQTALIGLMVLPVLTVLMRMGRGLRWMWLVRVYAISVPLLVAGDVMTWLIASGSEPLVLHAFGIVRIFITLLVASCFGLRVPSRVEMSS